VDVCVYRLQEEEALEEEDESGEFASFQLMPLPHKTLHGLWEALVYEESIKSDLLNYVYTAMIFSQKEVNPHIIGWNRVVLLHGPPGTGKTSLCKALAHKLAVRLRRSYASYDLVEINAHSLFSKWFSESGKLVMKMFGAIRELALDPQRFVCILIDEVESLTAARSKAMQGSEPSDAIRVVNAVLTELDKIKAFPNVLIMTTSNITGAIDEAFLDRADIVQYIGPPGIAARYEILASCVNELESRGLIESLPSNAMEHSGASSSSLSSSNQIIPSFKSLLQLIDSGHSTKSGKGTSPPVTQSHLTNLTQQSLKHLLLAPEELASIALLESVLSLDGFSGRALRKLPFIAASVVLNGAVCSLGRFAEAIGVAGRQFSARKK
jgi:DNA polymerase III delta prime subunit